MKGDAAIREAFRRDHHIGQVPLAGLPGAHACRGVGVFAQASLTLISSWGL